MEIKESAESNHTKVVASWKEEGEEERMEDNEKEVIIWVEKETVILP